MSNLIKILPLFFALSGALGCAPIDSGDPAPMGDCDGDGDSDGDPGLLPSDVPADCPEGQLGCACARIADNIPAIYCDPPLTCDSGVCWE